MLKASLYIHIPWCIQKCPYCDFNSHKSPTSIDEPTYIDHLISDFQEDVNQFGPRQISSIFIGGGTPSLLSADAYEKLLAGLHQILPIDRAIEITMEANPGTVEQQRFSGYRNVGINRLSLGIQSFNARHLAKLGRIHDDQQAHHAIRMAREAGFDNINLDIMHGLPEQTVNEGLTDLEMALAHQPEHLSWYQLTLEPNTFFYKHPPLLPEESTIDQLEETGMALLQLNDFVRYEISAFSRPSYEAQHNLNYWTFGDYFGIGAGAHGKLTASDQTTIFRTQKKRQPQAYQQTLHHYTCNRMTLTPDDIVFEYMLNTTRLEMPFSFRHFEQQTGIAIELLMPNLQKAQAKELIMIGSDYWQITPFGRRFTNELQELFLKGAEKDTGAIRQEHVE